jgi:hypothetical protein
LNDDVVVAGGEHSGIHRYSLARGTVVPHSIVPHEPANEIATVVPSTDHALLTWRKGLARVSELDA